MPERISITSGIGYIFRSSGGGSSTPLVAGANPPAQYAPAGTTSLDFTFPAATGGTPPLTYSPPQLVAPPGSSASLSGSAPGVVSIVGGADEEAYLIRSVVTDANGQQVLNDALGSIGEAAFVPLAPIVAPARQELAGDTSTALVTFTQPGAPPGMIYSNTILDATTGATITPLSGADLGPYAFALTAGRDYIDVITGTAPDGQTATAVAVVAVEDFPLSLSPPDVLNVAAGVTSATLVSEEAVGGTGPYQYDAQIVFDSTETGTPAITGISGRNISLSFLVNGLTLQILITATDSLGATTTTTAVVVVSAVAAGAMLPGAFPASQLLDSTATTANISFNPVTGSYVDPVAYVATVQSGESSPSNVGTDVALTGLTQGTTQVIRLRATDSTPGTPLVADAYGIVDVQPDFTNPLLWSPIRFIDLESALNAQGPFVLGSQTVNLIDGITGLLIPCTLVHTMASGSFATITSAITTGDGWRMQWAATATGTFCRGPLKIPLPINIGYDDDIRVTLKGYTNQPVTNNSSYWQLNRASVTPPAEDSANCWAGNRILRNGVAASALRLSAQSGASGSLLTQSTTPPCPLSWLNGSVELTSVFYMPRYTNRARVNMTGTGSAIACDLGLVGVAASSTALRGGWVAGNNYLWLFHGGSNGGASGGGAQFTRITSILVERRTLP